MSNLPSACPKEQFVAWNFFLKFWIVSGFLQEPLAWFSKFYLRVQSKNCGRISFFLFFFSEFFRIFSNIFSDFWPKNFKKLSNYPVRKQTNNFWLEFFFYSFESLWVFCRNLWHSPKTSIFVSRVKIPWGEFFLFFFLEFFPDFERNIFQTSGQKTSGSFQNYLLRFQEKSLWLEIFFTVLSRFGFSAETFGMVLKILSTCPE